MNQNSYTNKSKVDIAIVVGSQDLELLFQLLTSINKYWKPNHTSKVLLYVHKQDLKYIKKILNKVSVAPKIFIEVIIREKNLEIGMLDSYLSQRIFKLKSFKDSDAEYIWMLDCDQLLTSDFHEDLFFDDCGRVAHFYDKFKENTDLRWKSDSERMLANKIESNYMVDGWNIFPSSGLRQLQNKLSDVEWSNFPVFSEFYLISQFLNDKQFNQIIIFKPIIYNNISKLLNQDSDSGQLKLSNYREINLDFKLLTFWSHWDECAQVMHFINIIKSIEGLEEYLLNVDFKRFRIFQSVKSKSIKLILDRFSYLDGWIHNEIYFKSRIPKNVLDLIEVLDQVNLRIYLRIPLLNKWFCLDNFERYLKLMKFLPFEFKYIFKFANPILETPTGRKLYGTLRY